MQLGGQGLGAVVGGVGRIGVGPIRGSMAGGGLTGGGGGALDGVLDLAEDALAGGGAVLGGVAGGRDGVGEAAREGDAAADGAGGAVEGGCEPVRVSGAGAGCVPGSCGAA